MSSKVELHTRVLDELIRQREIWGEQNHPWHPTEVDDTNLVTWTGRGVLTADNAKALVGIFAEEGTLTYADILMEEVILTGSPGFGTLEMWPRGRATGGKEKEMVKRENLREALFAINRACDPYDVPEEMTPERELYDTLISARDAIWDFLERT